MTANGFARYAFDPDSACFCIACSVVSARAAVAMSPSFAALSPAARTYAALPS